MHMQARESVLNPGQNTEEVYHLLGAVGTFVGVVEEGGHGCNLNFWSFDDLVVSVMAILARVVGSASLGVSHYVISTDSSLLRVV